MKKIVIFCGLLCCLFACGNNSTTSKTCTLDGGKNGSVKTATIEYEDKKAKTIHFIEKAPLAKEQFESKSEEELQKLFESHYIKKNQEQKGMTFDIKVSEKDLELVVDIKMDVTKMSKSDLIEYHIDEDLRLEKIVETYEAQNYVCDSDK